MKIKLFQLAMTFVAVVALASAGITEIQYWEDFESYDEGYNIKENLAGFPNLAGWGHRYGDSKPFVASGVSMPTLECNAGKKSLTTEPLGAGDYGMEFHFPELNLPLKDTSVIGLWAMTGPGWPVETSEVFYARITDDGKEYTLSSTDDKFLQYKNERDQYVRTEIPLEPNTWYRVMWVGTGTSVNLRVGKGIFMNNTCFSVEDTLLYSYPTPTNISGFDFLFFRYDTRVDNVFIADNVSNIKACAVAPEGKLTTTWGCIKAE